MKRKKLKVLKREDRTCGACNACCTVFGIQDLKKKAGVDCVHLDKTKPEHHCSIYATRPLECSEYTCGWVRNAGFGGDEHRPDKVGVVFTPRDNKWECAPFAGPFTLIAHETREGAFSEPEAMKLMEYIAGRFIILAFWGPTLTKCRTMGPADRIKAVMEWCQENGYQQFTGILKGSVPSFEHFSRRLV